MRSADVPVKILGLQIEREYVGDQGIESPADLRRRIHSEIRPVPCAGPLGSSLLTWSTPFVVHPKFWKDWLGSSAPSAIGLGHKSDRNREPEALLCGSTNSPAWRLAPRPRVRTQHRHLLRGSSGLGLPPL